MVIQTRLGAAPLIAKQAAPALRPDAPELINGIAPPDPRTLRDSVATDVNGLLLTLAAVAVVVGALGIANTTLVAILERTAEIGLRRSLGARPRHIAMQFLTEACLLGAFGGLIGASAGVLVVIVVSVLHDWTSIIDPRNVLPAPLVGAAIGLLAGIYPAIRASRIEPARAMRQ
jgi:putative ABC transport system permease protein